MTVDTVETKQAKFSFFITGQADKRNALPTPKMFEDLWENKFKADKKPALEQKVFEDSSTRHIVFSILEYDDKANFYMGYVGKFRDSTLPSKFNRETLNDEPFTLEQSDEVMEKSYFIYYPETDILVFNCNHWGPRADDLAYMLFTLSELTTPIHFDAIWKDADVKALLETGSVIKSGSITLALPRRFEMSNLDLKNSWSKDVIKMMSSSGMSSMRIDFRSRAAKTKNGMSYVSQEVRDGFKEILQNFGKNRKLHKSEISVRRAEVYTSKNEKKQSLLNQELTVKLPVQIAGRYPTISGMRQTLINAKVNCQSVLIKYERNNR